MCAYLSAFTATVGLEMEHYWNNENSSKKQQLIGFLSIDFSQKLYLDSFFAFL